MKKSLLWTFDGELMLNSILTTHFGCQVFLKPSRLILKMKAQLKFCLILFLVFGSKAVYTQGNENSWIQVHTIDSNKIELSVIYEGTLNINGEMVKSYSLVWDDTLGQSKNYPKYNRPFELNVVIRSQDSIVGKYTGLSSQMTHCTFITNADFVTIYFWLTPNFFFDWHPYSKDSIIGFRNSYYDYWNKINFNRKEYLPIRINMQKIESNNIIDGYNKKATLLETNSNIVRLYHPDPMPKSNMGLSAGLKQVIALDRYLLNTASGRIKLGKKWIRKYGIAKTSEMDFRVIDPHLIYTTKSGQHISGKKLIRKNKIDTASFESYEFETLQWSLPYSIN